MGTEIPQERSTWQTGPEVLCYWGKNIWDRGPALSEAPLSGPVEGLRSTSQAWKACVRGHSCPEYQANHFIMEHAEFGVYTDDLTYHTSAKS